MITFERLQDSVAEARSMGKQYETGLSEQRMVKTSWAYWLLFVTLASTVLVGVFLRPAGIRSESWLTYIFVLVIAQWFVITSSLKIQKAVREGKSDSLGALGWTESASSRKRRADAASAARLARGRIVWLADMIEVQIARAFESQDQLVVIPHYEPEKNLFMGLEKTEVLAWIEPLGDPKRANPLVKVIHPSGKEEIKELTVNQERELVLIDQFKHDRSWKPC